MEKDVANIKLTVQETVDELFRECLLPFKLTAYKVCEDGPGEYVVPFHDSRLHSVRFSCANDSSVKEVVRAAILDRVQK